ncbi:MAG: chemotaxis protein CheD [Gudongella sp.]|nr:chemotaxis protein CheD [Gudongella sp.]
MENFIRVGIAEYRVSQAPEQFITIGLGSCVGIAVYDTISKIGGLSHILLPDSTCFSNVEKPEKFANLAIPLMVEKIKNGSKYNRLVAKIAGGASMFFQSEDNEFGGIGQKNVEAVLKTLQMLGIPVIGEETGGTVGRTMMVNLESFEVMIKSVDKKIVNL